MATGIYFLFEPVQVTDSPPIFPLYASSKLHFFSLLLIYQRSHKLLDSGLHVVCAFY